VLTSRVFDKFHLWSFAACMPLLCVSARQPSATPVVSCVCMPFETGVTWGCPDQLYASWSVVPLASGKCYDFWGGCFDADPCSWEYSLEFKSTNPSSPMGGHWNGGPARIRGQGSLGMGPLNQTLDCGMTADVGISSNGQLCVQVFMECDPCP
jgi:hypothetical protein